MGKSIRSKRQKRLRTIKREALAPTEQIKVAALHAKLNAAVEKQTEEATGVKAEDRMKDETVLPQPVIPALPAAPVRFTHSHPKPRDPADPTVRPYPRGRPRTPKTIAASHLPFKDAVVRETGRMEEEKGEEKDGEEVKVDEVRTRVVRRVKAERAAEMMGDSEVEEEETGEVSYVSVGKPARVRRSKVIAAKKRGLSRKRGKVGALLANWNRLNGMGCN